MKRLILLLASLLAGTACSAPTAPSRDDAARASRSRASLESASGAARVDKLAAN
jgi:hypothetical protein